MKSLVYLILLSINIFALQQDNNFLIEKKIMAKIAHAIIPDKKIIKIYLRDTRYPKTIYKKDFKIVKDCNSANLIILGDDKYQKCLSKNIPIIVLDYNLLKKYPSAVGAFFWQKGRPNIVIIDPRIKKMGVHLPKEFDRYIESRIW